MRLGVWPCQQQPFGWLVPYFNPMSGDAAFAVCRVPAEPKTALRAPQHPACMWLQEARRLGSGARSVRLLPVNRVASHGMSPLVRDS
ncbi:hypothetical protein Q31a_15800 [Aureliella helgolandensis]|uniref:Uncharacterized protein n=1 Tax=Aureliella helgolandensis TaxID=2527968 RepID=A0A518G3W5_9BACT|nr:hypothetical protein Q31a_15800 [Aureliella helgolandensis]